MPDRRGRPDFAGLDEQAAWSTVLDLEPGDPQRLDPRGLERCCEAIADFADLKSPHTLGHSSGVARLATGAGRRAGLLEADVTVLRHAALLHDVGRAGVSAGVWGKPGPLSDREWEQVRLHPYYTERVLAQPEPLARLGRLASQHHERLNGSGYHRAATAGSLSPAARILAAADAYQAMTEPRPHRPALAAAAAANHRSRVVGVVLSGYLDDGAEGMRDIVRSGGVGIAQDPAEAVNPEMPENAIMRAELELALPLAAIAAKIDELASGGVVVVRPEMGESRGDHLEPERPDVQIGADDSPGAPTGLTCPECHGVLWAGPDITSQVFHCRVGHSYSIETLQEEQRMAVERALWAAVRSLREQAAVAEHVAGRAEDRALEAIARRYRKRERAANENADTLERILMRDVPEDAEDLEA